MGSETEHGPPEGWCRYRMTLAYDGRSFEGWQSQRSGNTIQDQLLESLRSIAPEVRAVYGSGRTDAGVSADAQVAHFDAPVRASLQAPDWQRALNARLPATIRIMDLIAAPGDFHARFSARGKRYEYRLCLAEVLPPLELGRAWAVRRDFSRDRFAEALAVYVGRHDFSAFAANRGDGRDEDRDCVRTLHLVEATQDPVRRDFLLAAFEGDGFLYRMVRLLVGTAARVAEGNLDLSELQRLVEAPLGGEKAPFCAPADGLRLVRVFYDD